MRTSDHRERRRIRFLLPLLSLAVALAVLATLEAIPPAHATALGIDGTVRNTACAAATTCALGTGLTTSNGDDLYVVECTADAASTFNAPSDSGSQGVLGTFTQRGSTYSQQSMSFSLWYASYSGTTSADVVSCSISTSATALKIAVFAVSGADLTTPFDPNAALPSDANGASGTTATCSETTTNADDLLLSTILTQSTATPATPASFTTLSSQTGTLAYALGAYEIVSSAQSAAAVQWTGLTSGAAYAVDCDAIQQQETELVTVTPAGGYASSASLAVTGCHATPTTILMDGVQQTLSADHGCSITYTVPSDQAAARYRFASVSTTWIYTTAPSGAGTESKADAVYYQLEPTFTAAADAQTTFDSGLGTLAVTGTVSGSAATACTIAPASGSPSDACAGFVDYGSTPTVPSTVSGAPANTQWACQACNFGTITTAGTPTVGYYKQVTNALKVANNPVDPAGCSSSCVADALWNGATFTIDGTLFGVPNTTVCSVTPTSGTGGTTNCGTSSTDFTDYGTAYVGLTSTSNPSGTQWACNATGTGVGYCSHGPFTTGGAQFLVRYWLQDSITLEVSALVGTPQAAFTGSEVFKAILNQTDQNETVTLNAPAAACAAACGATTVFADYGSTVSFDPYGAVSSASCGPGCTGSSTERWYLPTGASDGSHGKCVGLSSCSNEILAGGTFDPHFTLQYELTGNSNFDIQTVNSMTAASGAPDFAWIFGYQNDGLEGTSQTTTAPQWPSVAAATAAEVGAVQNLTSVFGGANVADVRAVDLSNGGTFPPTGTLLAGEQAYVDSMYATGAQYVFCRFSFNTQTLTTPSTSNAVVTFALKSQASGGLGCDGVWFDLAASYYYGNQGGGPAGQCAASIGEYCFNHMMQNLTNTYPAATWIMQQDSPGKHIVALANDTWQQHTWMLIDVTPGTGASTTSNWLTEAQGQVTVAEQYFGDQVMLHLDNAGSSGSEPMGLFAQSSTASEELTVGDMLGNMSDYGVGSLLPFFGGSYYDPGGASCHFYDSLTVPVNASYSNSYPVTPPCARGTVDSFDTSLLHNSWFDYGAAISITLNGAYGSGAGITTVITSYSWDGGAATPEGTSGTFTLTQTMTASHSLDLDVTTRYQVTSSTSATSTASTVTSSGSGGAFVDPSTASYLEVAVVAAAVTVVALALSALKDKRGARKIVVKIGKQAG